MIRSNETHVISIIIIIGHTSEALFRIFLATTHTSIPYKIPFTPGQFLTRL